MVAAASNFDNPYPAFPARFPEVLCVGGLNYKGSKVSEKWAETADQLPANRPPCCNPANVNEYPCTGEDERKCERWTQNTADCPPCCYSNSGYCPPAPNDPDSGSDCSACQHTPRLSQPGETEVLYGDQSGTIVNLATLASRAPGWMQGIGLVRSYNSDPESHPGRPFGSGSAYGPRLDVMAPAMQNFTTTNQRAVAGRLYDYYGATSSAAPQVAGIAALLFSVNENLSAYEAKAILTSTADDMIYTDKPWYLHEREKADYPVLPGVFSSVPQPQVFTIAALVTWLGAYQSKIPEASAALFGPTYNGVRYVCSSGDFFKPEVCQDTKPDAVAPLGFVMPGQYLYNPRVAEDAHAGRDDFTGFGVVNAARAVQWAQSKRMVLGADGTTAVASFLSVPDSLKGDYGRGLGVLKGRVFERVADVSYVFDDGEAYGAELLFPVHDGDLVIYSTNPDGSDDPARPVARFDGQAGNLFLAGELRQFEVGGDAITLSAADKPFSVATADAPTVPFFTIDNDGDAEIDGLMYQGANPDPEGGTDRFLVWSDFEDQTTGLGDYSGWDMDVSSGTTSLWPQQGLWFEYSAGLSKTNAANSAPGAFSQYGIFNFYTGLGNAPADGLGGFAHRWEFYTDITEPYRVTLEHETLEHGPVRYQLWQYYPTSCNPNFLFGEVHAQPKEGRVQRMWDRSTYDDETSTVIAYLGDGEDDEVEVTLGAVGNQKSYSFSGSIEFLDGDYIVKIQQTAGDLESAGTHIMEVVLRGNVEHNQAQYYPIADLAIPSDSEVIRYSGKLPDIGVAGLFAKHSDEESVVKLRFRRFVQIQTDLNDGNTEEMEFILQENVAPGLVPSGADLLDALEQGEISVEVFGADGTVQPLMRAAIADRNQFLHAPGVTGHVARYDISTTLSTESAGPGVRKTMGLHYKMPYDNARFQMILVSKDAGGAEIRHAVDIEHEALTHTRVVAAAVTDRRLLRTKVAMNDNGTIRSAPYTLVRKSETGTSRNFKACDVQAISTRDSEVDSVAEQLVGRIDSTNSVAQLAGEWYELLVHFDYGAGGAPMAEVRLRLTDQHPWPIIESFPLGTAPGTPVAVEIRPLDTAGNPANPLYFDNVFLYATGQHPSLGQVAAGEVP
jgi:hypothetical protein